MKKKIIVPALALLAGVSLAGSITSTVAWYQYSTKTTAAYLGVSGGTSQNLQMRIVKAANQDAEDDWTSRITYTQMAEFLAESAYAGYGADMNPITTGNFAKTDAIGSFYGNPKAGYVNPAKWRQATTKDYVVIPLQLRYVERDADSTTFLAKEVSLSDLHIAKHGSSNDISDAIRVHFSAIQDDAAANTRKNLLFSKQGGSIDTHGQLDLDSEPGDDYYYTADKYGFGGTTKAYYDYGSGEQEAYAFDDANLQSLGSTVATTGKYLNVTVTIWVEGWQELLDLSTADPDDKSSVWDVTYIASQFEVGFEMEADA